jgi:hypothetical protein
MLLRYYSDARLSRKTYKKRGKRVGEIKRNRGSVEIGTGKEIR